MIIIWTYKKMLVLMGKVMVSLGESLIIIDTSWANLI